MAHVKAGTEGGGMGQGTKKSFYKCKIPLRMGTGRLRPPCKSKFNSEQEGLVSRPRSAEVARPKSAPRVKEEPGSQLRSYTPTHPMQLARQSRPDKERSMPGLKRPSNVPRRIYDMNGHKYERQVITVPQHNCRNSGEKNFKNNSPSEDMNYIHEHDAHSNATNNLESKGEDSEKVMRLRVIWQEKLQSLVDQYQALQSTREEMAELGERVRVPSIEELRVMNVGNMTPKQLRELCDGGAPARDLKCSVNSSLLGDVEMLYSMLNSIISTCEQTLQGREQMICWFEDIMSQKMITKNALAKKVEQFKSENNLCKNNLDNNKKEIMHNINDTVEIMKKTVSDAVANQLRFDELVFKLSELSTMNEDLRKQLRTTEHRVFNKAKLEELERTLKDEKSKKMLLKDRMSRAEGQLKSKDDKISQLDAAWEQAHAKTLALERTVYQLREENKMLKEQYDDQMQILSDSIKENIAGLEEIAAERERLTNEKEDLEKRLSELSEHYKDSLKEMKTENNLQVTKLIEYEKKHGEVLEEKVKLESKIENLCAQLIESELRYKELSKRLAAAESHANEVVACRQEIETLRHALDKANMELLTLQNLLTKKTEAFNDLENNFKKSVGSEEILRSNLNMKEKYISELEKQRSLLEQRLKESENIFGSYADELSDLKAQISRLLKDVGEFENLDELRKMVDVDRQRLREVAEQNKILAEELKKKEEEVEQHLESVAEQARLLEQREAMLAMLSEKDEEQANIIKLLRNNLEIRAQADVDLNQQIVEKSTEIDSLISNLEARKVQISQMEKIILALEEQTRKSDSQKRKDKDTIVLLEKKLAEYESYFLANGRNHYSSADNLDNLINMLENELGNPFDTDPTNKDSAGKLSKQQNEPNKRDKQVYQGNNGSAYQPPRENRPTKIVMGNYVKKTYIANKDQPKHESLNRKKAITSMETQNWLASHDPELTVMPKLNDKQLPCFKGFPPRRPYSLLPHHLGDEKKSKMFKFAGHRL